MTEIKHHTIRANDIRQHCMEAGEGAPVILLHGFPETSYAGGIKSLSWLRNIGLSLPI
jgi:hypothetical protein